MTARILDFVSIVLASLVTGVFFGPWLAVSRSMGHFTPEVFLALVHRMDRNLGTVMGYLMPITLLSIVTVLVDSPGSRPEMFVLTLAAFALFVMTLVVTAVIEVPIVAQIRGWTVSTMPPDWQQRRDRWMSFHRLRVFGGLAGLALLVAGPVFQPG